MQRNRIALLVASFALIGLLAMAGAGWLSTALFSYLLEISATVEEVTPLTLEDVNEIYPPTPGIELQATDYADVRKTFTTKLVRRGPAPLEAAPLTTPEGAERIAYTSDGRELAAFVDAATADAPRPGVLFLHSGMSFGGDDWRIVQPLRDAGYVVMTPILRGENGQPGDYSMFYDEVDDVLAAADAFGKLPHVDDSQIFVAGHSVGATMAILAVMASDRFQGAASLDGQMDWKFVAGDYPELIVFDQNDIREFQVRSPLAYVRSLKSPALWVYASDERDHFYETNSRIVSLAVALGYKAQWREVEGDHISMRREGIQLAIEFFDSLRSEYRATPSAESD